MSIERELKVRSNSICELCGADDALKIYAVPPAAEGLDKHIMVCNTCYDQIENPEKMDANHWRCLNDSMWSEVAAVQVVAWRMLNRLRSEGWPQDLLDMMYLDEDMLAWAAATGEGKVDDGSPKHVDSNGVELFSGDSVVLVKTLKVKGSSLEAKRGVAVRNISLVHDNHEQIEGRVEGQQIVILTQYVKKTK